MGERLLSGDSEKKRVALRKVLAAIRRDLDSEKDETETIGIMLYALHKMEGIIAHLMSVWAFPLVAERSEYLTSEMLLKIPARDKLAFLKDQKFLDKKHLDQLHNILERRNSLAHPRSKRIAHMLPSSERDEFLQTINSINRILLDRAKQELDAIAAYIEKIVTKGVNY